MARIFLVILLFIDLNAFAQQTAIYLEPERDYKTGLDLFEKQKYGAAQKEFLKVISSRENISTLTLGNSHFYNARCASELFNKDAEYLLLNFIENYPANPNYSSAIFELGNYYYRLKRYKNAIEWFMKVDQTELEADKKDEINFKIGYSYYKTNDLPNASKSFYTLKDGNTKYATAAQYYYSHIAYMNENYETALNGFLKLKNSEAFAPIAPYYITQIYYRQKKYDEVLKYAPAVIDTASTRNGLEIERIVAESYFRMEKYKEALPYLVDYEKNSPGSGRIDLYTIAFCYYRTNEYEKAIGYFQKVIVGDDSLTQNAYYHLADCYLKTKNKKAAQSAFHSAAKSSFDPAIQEESQFNYAKLSYELNFQSGAIEAFRSFLEKFPQSAHTNEANEMLVNIYTSTHNYKDAITALEGIKNKSENLKAAYQKALYYRGIELFMDNKLDEAIKMFASSQTYPLDQSLVALAFYWSGEAYYRLKEYEESIRSYSEFLVTPASLKMKLYNTANYNIGYALFKKEDYSSSQMAFRKFLQERSQTDPQRYNDALLRIGDCFFMAGDKANALDFYSQAIANGAKAGDYALYQKAILLGVQSRFAEKVATLQKLLDKYPKSVYYDDALYESGRASFHADNNDEALKFYSRLKKEFPSSPYIRKADIDEAQVYYNTKQDTRAIDAYKKIIQKYPNTDEFREALDQLQKISVEQNKVEEYVAFIKTIPDANISDVVQDSLTYQAAELRLTQGNCTVAIEDFTNYLTRFPHAIFKLNANYLRSDCLFRGKKYTEALAGYEYVISQPVNSYTEKSLLNAGIINYNQKEYDKALIDFEKLEEIAKSKDNILASLSGQLRCNSILKNCEKCYFVSQKIFNSPVADKDLINEAHLVSGRCQVNEGNYSEAKTELSIVTKRTPSEMTAESKYLLAFVEYKLGNYKESQKLIEEIQKQVPSYDYWIAKSFILSGDNYLALGNAFQAQEIYKSIVEKYEAESTDPEDLQALAKEKLLALQATEKVKEDEKMKLKQERVPKDTLDIEN